ncbi:MAG: RDD family protein [Desulfobacteria bacterium]
MESPMEHPSYARFWSRAAARIIDLLIIIAAFNLIYLADRLGADAGLWTGMGLGEWNLTGSEFSMANVFRGLFYLAFPIFYYVYLHGKYGQTFGKMALKIKVMNTDGTDLDCKKALIRWLVEFLFSPILVFLLLVVLLLLVTVVEFLLGKVSSVFSPADYLVSALDWVVGLAILFLVFIPSAIMFLWVAFDHRKQGLHDKVCRTIVVRTDVPYPLPEAVEPEAPAEARPDAPASLDTGASPPL